MPCPNHFGRRTASPLHNGQRTASPLPDGQPNPMDNAPRRPDANRHGVVMVGVRRVGVRHVGATRWVAPTQWATHRVAPTRWATQPDGQRTASPRREPARRGDGCGTAGGVRHVGARHPCPNHFGRRTASPQPFWATHRVAPTRWATRPDGRRTASPRREPARRGDGCGTVCGGAARRGDPVGRPNPMGDAPRRPDANRHAVVMVAVRHVGARHAVPQPFWATHRVAPTRWATRCDGQRTASPRPVGSPLPDGQCTAMGDAPRRLYPMGNAPRWTTHRVAPTRTGVPW
ncbi:MAG: hypothetical protein KatS3mg054_0918 [Chloroflexus sp.]|nr:MAG: hypothetical protein KatS3mg054_0918 [Chloroflexus sp.]